MGEFYLNTPYYSPRGSFCDDIIICDDPEATKTEDQHPMKTHYSFQGSSAQYSTQDEAETAAKKYMASAAKGYGLSSNIAIYKAVACVKFPTPAYEVVALDDAAKA